MGFGAALNVMSAADGAKQGVNRAGQELSKTNPVNKYDQALNNSVSVVKKDFMGNTNAVNAGRENLMSEASTLLDEMYQEKLALEQDDDSKKRTFDNRRFDNRRFNNNRNRDNRNNRNGKPGFGAGGFSPVNNPNVGPYGDRVYNNTNNDSKKDYLSYAVLGSMAVGLGAYQAIKKRNIMAPINDVKSNFWPSIRQGVYAAPKRFIETLPGGKVALKSVRTADKVIQDLARAEERAGKYSNTVNKARKVNNVVDDAQQVVDAAHNGYDATQQFNEFRQAFIDDFEDMEKVAYANYENNKHFFKTLLKEDFLQNGLRSIPYVTAPVAVSHLVGRNLKVDGSKLDDKSKFKDNDKIVIDVPIESLSKKASYAEEISKLTEEAVIGGKRLHKIPTMKEFFKEEMPRAAVKGVSYAAFPTTAILLTKRDLRGMGEKINNSDSTDNSPIKPGMARITIQTGTKSRTGHSYDKMAKELIDEMYKEATLGNPISHIEKGLEETIKKTDLSSSNAKQLSDAKKTLLSSMPVQGMKQKTRMIK